MSSSGHIVSVQNRNTRGKNMIEMFMSNLWIIAPSLWAGFLAYVIWYSARVKTYEPITRTEARQLWVIHQQDSHCGSTKWRQLRKRGVTVGFECGCGHKHMQLRPVVAHLASTAVQLPTTTLNAAEPQKQDLVRTLSRPQQPSSPDLITNQAE